MAQDYDWDESVDLFGISRPFNSSELVSIKVATLPLREALATIVETWANDRFRQLSAVILRPSGESIRSFDEIRRLYQEVRPSLRRASIAGVAHRPEDQAQPENIPGGLELNPSR